MEDWNSPRYSCYNLWYGIVKSALLSTWIGGFGRFAGAATIIAGVSVAYIGFAYFEGKYLLPDRS
jgi:hypothetical protein